jgi:hypothetical protein
VHRPPTKVGDPTNRLVDKTGQHLEEVIVRYSESAGHHIAAPYAFSLADRDSCRTFLLTFRYTGSNGIVIRFVTHLPVTGGKPLTLSGYAGVIVYVSNCFCYRSTKLS